MMKELFKLVIIVALVAGGMYMRDPNMLSSNPRPDDGSEPDVQVDNVFIDYDGTEDSHYIIGNVTNYSDYVVGTVNVGVLVMDADGNSLWSGVIYCRNVPANAEKSFRLKTNYSSDSFDVKVGTVSARW